MATGISQQPSNQAYMAHRTQAMPENSLFGTSLEINKKKDHPTNEQSANKQEKRKRRELPDHLKTLLTSTERVIHKQQEFKQQRDIVQQRQKDLKMLERKALTFDPDPRTTREGTKVSKYVNGKNDKSYQWFTKKDFDHVKDINVGGLTCSDSLNRDRYGKRLSVYSYSQMGDLLHQGMEFTSNQMNCNQNRNPDRKPHCRTNITNNMELSTPVHNQLSPQNVITLPPNIRHSFGSKICDELLSDDKKVHDIMAKHERTRFPPRHDQHTQPIQMAVNSNPEYNGLSNATRQNVFPGYTTGHKQSITKTVYNDMVYHQRYPDPDEYRYQRDELSKWAEHNVLRERMKKAWDQKDESGEKRN